MPKLVAVLLAFGSATVSPVSAADVTYNKDVAPILWKHCAECHRPGEVAPFSLLTYKDAAKRAAFIHEVTAKRDMPPWKPEPGEFELHDARRLSDAELAVFAQWAKTGAKEGDPRDLPPAPRFPGRDEWRLGKPDLVLTMAEPFTVPASGPDIYRCFVIPTGVTETRQVAAVEFRAGNPRVVHHALFFLDRSGQGRARDKADPGPGYASFGGIGGIIPSGDLGAWTPGMTPRYLAPEVCMPLAKGSDLILQVHYQPSGKQETDQSSLALYFGKNPKAKGIMPVPLVNFSLRIPAGAKRHRVTASYTLPVDVQAVGIQPHMHYLGREITTSAVLPDGKRKTLLTIKDWNFNWQDRYLFKELIPLPKGTRLECEAYYDNSAGNPLNPHRPPREVVWGEATSEEMLLCPVYVAGNQRGDYTKLFLGIVATPGVVQNWFFESGGKTVRPASTPK